METGILSAGQRQHSAHAEHCGTTVLSYAAQGLSMDGMVVLRNCDRIRAIGAGSHGVSRQAVADRPTTDYRGRIRVPELDGVSCEEPKALSASR